MDAFGGGESLCALQFADSVAQIIVRNSPKPAQERARSAWHKRSNSQKCFQARHLQYIVGPERTLILGGDPGLKFRMKLDPDVLKQRREGRFITANSVLN